MKKETPKFKPMVSPFMNKGTMGDGAGLWLEILCILGYGEGVVMDDELGDKSVENTKRMQIELLGFGGKDADGNPGPNTREALKEKTGIDIMAVPARPNGQTVWYGPETDDPQIW